MNEKRLLIIGGSICILLLLIVIPFVEVHSQPAPVKRITLRFAGGLPVGNIVTDCQYRFADLVGKKTNGQVKIEVYPSGQLYKEENMAAALSSGALDMGTLGPPKISGEAPLLEYHDLPFIFSDMGHFARFQSSPEVQEIENEELGRMNLWLVFSHIYSVVPPPITNVPTHKIGDYKGLKIRVPGVVLAWTSEALGGTPTFLSAGEVYMGLSRRTIDGVISGLSSIVSRKWYEPCRYIVGSEICFGKYIVIASKKFWNDLPKDTQKVLIEAGKTVLDESVARIGEETKKQWQVLRDNGVTIYQLPPDELTRWKEVFKKDVFDRWAQKVGKQKADKLLGAIEKYR